MSRARRIDRKCKKQVDRLRRAFETMQYDSYRVNLNEIYSIRVWADKNPLEPELVPSGDYWSECTLTLPDSENYTAPRILSGNGGYVVSESVMADSSEDRVRT